MFTNVMSKFNSCWKIGFITTDGDSRAKFKVKLTSTEESIIIDIFEHPNNVGMSESKDTDIDFDEILKCINIEERGEIEYVPQVDSAFHGQ